jgi:hypothetical protein
MADASQKRIGEEAYYKQPPNIEAPMSESYQAKGHKS